MGSIMRMSNFDFVWLTPIPDEVWGLCFSALRLRWERTLEYTGIYVCPWLKFYATDEKSCGVYCKLEVPR